MDICEKILRRLTESCQFGSSYINDSYQSPESLNCMSNQQIDEVITLDSQF